MPFFNDAFIIGHWCLSDLVLGAPGVSHLFEDSCWRDGQATHDGFYVGGSGIPNLLDPTKTDGHAFVQSVASGKAAIAASKCCAQSAAGVLLVYNGDPIFTEVIFSVGAVEPNHNSCFVPVGAVPWWDQNDFSFGVWAYGNADPYVIWPGTFRERAFNGGAIADASFAIFGDGVPVGWGINSDGSNVFVTYNSEATGASFSLACGSLGIGSSAWNFYGFSADSHGVRSYKNGQRVDSTARGLAIGGQQLTFGNRNATGVGDISQMADPFNGAFGAPLMLSRALSDDEWKDLYTQGCEPQAKIKARIRVFVSNELPPHGGTQDWSGSQPKIARAHQGDTQITGATISSGTIQSITVPPQGEKNPEYLYSKRGAHVFRDTKYGAGAGAFGIEVWPSDTWVPLSFVPPSAVYDRANGKIIRASTEFFSLTGDQFFFDGWSAPEVAAPSENPEWNGGKGVGVSFPDVGFGPTGHTPTWPHWYVSPGDETYSTWLPEVIANGTVIDGWPWDIHDVIDTGVIDPDYFRTNFPFTWDEADQSFKTFSNNPGDNNLFASGDYSSLRGYEIYGQLLFPSLRDYGFGYQWGSYKDKVFKVRLRETVTNTVISQHGRTGYDMGFFETPTLDICRGAVTYGGSGVLGGTIGSDAFSLAPWGHAKIPSGRRFVVEIHQNTGVTLTHPVWGFMHLVSHRGGDLAFTSPYVDSSEDDWPTLP